MAQAGSPAPRGPLPWGAAHSLCAFVPRDRSGTHLSTGWGTAGRASATSSSVSDHLPAGWPRPPLPAHVSPPPAHVSPHTRALPPRRPLPRGDPGASAARSHRPPRTHPPAAMRTGDRHGDEPQRGREQRGGEQSPSALVPAWRWWLCHLSPCGLLCARCLCDPHKVHVAWVPHVVPGACVLPVLMSPWYLHVPSHLTMSP